MQRCPFQVTDSERWGLSQPKSSAICKKRGFVRSSCKQAQTGHRTVIRVPLFTEERSRMWSIFGSCRTWSTLKLIRCAVPWLSISVSPLAPSSANAMATIVFKALPCAPLVGEA
jgi:hypothetical protein